MSQIEWETTEIRDFKKVGKNVSPLVPPRYLAAFELATRRHCPRLHAHLRSEGFEPQLYGVEWFSALFVISVPKILSLCCLDLLYAKFDDAPLRPAPRGSTSLQLPLALIPRPKNRAWKPTERGGFEKVATRLAAQASPSPSSRTPRPTSWPCRPSTTSSPPSRTP